MALLLLSLSVLRALGGVSDRPEFFIDSDSLYYASLYKDLFVDGYPLSGWALATAPCFFPEMPVFFLIAALSNPALATALWGGALLVLWALAASYFLKTLLGGRTSVNFTTAALAGALVTYLGIVQRAPYWEDFFRLVHPHGSSFTLLLALVFQLKYLKKGKGPDLMLLFLLLFLGTISDLLFVPLALAPLVATNLLLSFQTRKRALVSILVILLSGYAAKRVLRLLVDAKAFYLWSYKLEAKHYGLRALFALSDYPARFWATTHWFSTALLGLAFLLGILLIAIFLLKKINAKHSGAHNMGMFRPETLNIVFFATFVLLSFGAVFAASGISGMAFYKDFLHPRYFPGVMSLLLLFVLACLRYALQGFKRSSVLLVSGQIACLFFLWVLWDGRLGQKLKSALGYRPSLAVCMDHNQKKYNLRYGLSDYWASKLVNMYSQTGIHALQISRNGGFYHWVNNFWWYYGKENQEKPRYHFIITTNLDRKHLKRLFGSPRARFSCQEHEVWVYPPGSNPRLEGYFDRKSLLLWKKLVAH